MNRMLLMPGKRAIHLYLLHEPSSHFFNLIVPTPLFYNPYVELNMLNKI